MVIISIIAALIVIFFIIPLVLMGLLALAISDIKTDKR